MPFALTPALVPSRASRRAHATRGGDTSTPRSLSTSSVAGEHEVAPAHPLGLLCVQNGYVVSVPRWIQPSEEGVEIGALATGGGRHHRRRLGPSCPYLVRCSKYLARRGLVIHQRNRGGKRRDERLHPGRARPLRSAQPRRRAQTWRIHHLRYPPRRRRPLVGRWGRSFYAGTPGHSMARQGQSPGDEAFILALGGHPR